MLQKVPSEHARAYVPKEIDAAALLLFALAIFQGLVAVMVILDREELAGTIAAANQNLGEDDVAGIVAMIIFGSVAVHTIVAALYIWIASRIRSGQRWTRIAATTLIAITTAAGIAMVASTSDLLPSERSGLIVEQALSLLLRAAVVYLLWFPPPARRFFAGYRFG